MSSRGQRGNHNRTLGATVKARPRPRLVAVVASERDLRSAFRLRVLPDYFELRLDALSAILTEEELLKAASNLRAPLILTERSRREGGLARHTSGPVPRAPWHSLLPFAAFVDVELRHAAKIRTVLGQAGRRGAGVIVSLHELKTSLTLRELTRALTRSRELGGDIFKVVARCETPSAVDALLSLTRENPGIVSAAGAGPLARVSRRILLRAGSVLNYGYLTRPVLPGQLSLRELRRVLRMGRQISSADGNLRERAVRINIRDE